jgi:hypothetical protein
MHPEHRPSETARLASFEELVSRVFDASIPVISSAFAELMQLNMRALGRRVGRRATATLGAAVQRVAGLRGR